MTTKVRACPNCRCEQPMKQFINKTQTVTYLGETIKIRALSGWMCLVCGKGDYDEASLAAIAKAGDELEELDRQRTGN